MLEHLKYFVVLNLWMTNVLSLCKQVLHPKLSEYNERADSLPLNSNLDFKRFGRKDFKKL